MLSGHNISYNRVMLYIVIFLFLAFDSFSQDEIEFKKMITRRINKPLSEFPDKLHSLKTVIFDLNRDGETDKIQLIKKNGLDYIRILDEKDNNVFEKELQTKGVESKIYKARFVTLSNKVNCLVLYFYEGNRQTHLFEGAARVYFLTIENKDLKKMYLFQGGHYFHEKLEFKDKYFLKEFTVNIKDLNKDGIKEVSLKYNKMSRTYMYLGKGSWNKL